MLTAVPASAQVTSATGAFTERPSDVLSRNLRSLAANPKSVTALMGAGRAALDLGDAQAALTFFARAEEQMPRDGRIKMWIGSALIHLQQPHAALKFFRDAAELGVPAADLARDRGLAYDVAGKPREAQLDYRLALRSGRDDETTRRLALSLAISGEREGALQLLEGQLLARDRAAERTRTLVLALTGDTAGATRAARAAMPGPQANAMAPFLARLPSLSPAERALAVHLGIFPGDGRTGPPATYAANDFANAVTDAGTPDSGQAALARRSPAPAPVSTAPRRRPGSEENRLAPPTRRTASRPVEQSYSSAAWALARNPLPVRRKAEAQPKPAESPAPRTEAARKPAETPPPAAAAKPEALAAAPPAATPPAAAPPVAEPATAEPAALAAAEPIATPVSEVAPSTAQPQPDVLPADFRLAEAAPAVPLPQAESAPSGSRLADLSAALAGISEPAPEPKPARAAADKPKPAARQAAATAKPAAKKAKPAPPAEPSRVWVQVAGGAQKAALPREYARLKTRAPKLLGARPAWTTPLNATNRLLVGPFAGAKEAQAFVNQLKAANLSGFAWTSAAGQKIEKLPAK
ncbi:MAG TPA: SPOR domain-containing protein [Allosphingosinicella sp.]|jgi:Flp pilus assembly protein TadD